MYIQPNIPQQCLDYEQGVIAQTMDAGGFVPVNKCPSTRNSDPPWLTMPIQGRIVTAVSSVVMGALVPNVASVVVSYQVPPGFDFALTQISNQFTGVGFAEGSGDIIWRLKINRRYVRNFGTILNTYGSTEMPWPINRAAITARENNIVQYLVQVPALLGVGDRVICGLYGWIYPMVPPGF